MKKILFTLLLCPFIAVAQENKPRFENDTLYTLSSYKIYIGKTIEFAIGLERYNRFKFVSSEREVRPTWKPFKKEKTFHHSKVREKSAIRATHLGHNHIVAVSA